MIPDFKTEKELEMYCSVKSCENCLLRNDCKNVQKQLGQSGEYAPLSLKIKELFIYYRKQKLKKLLS